MSNETGRYSMIIEWSDEDHAFLVSLPEFPDGHTHGGTYEEAAKHGREVIDLLVETVRADGKTLPTPKLFAGQDASPTLAS